MQRTLGEKKEDKTRWRRKEDKKTEQMIEKTEKNLKIKFKTTEKRRKRLRKRTKRHRKTGKKIIETENLS